MVVRNHRSPVTRETGRRFDTLLVSRDHTLFKQLSSFLKEFEPERTPVLIDNRASFAAFEDSIRQCDVMICDIRADYAEFELGASAMECVPVHTLTIGLTGNNECSQEVLSRPQHLRLGGIIDNRSGWFANWHQIAAIGQAWHNPLMVSRIEEVPVSDVLQMISSGRWNTIIHIEGYTAGESTETPTAPLRGCISFYQGEPQTAWSWRNAGIEAIFDLLSIKRGILQVIKNLCAPTIRNVFLQTEEILLSHAVALDESDFVPPAGDTVVTLPEIRPVSVFPAGRHEEPVPSEPPSHVAATRQLSWWQKNGTRLIESITGVQPQSLLLRWMNEDEFLRITCDQTESGCMLLYGNEETLVKLFSACSRRFLSEKLHDSGRFPVLRLGRSREQCLYLPGLDPSIDRKWTGNHPAALFVTPESPDHLEKLRLRHRCPLLLIADPRHTLPQETPGDSADATFPVRTIAAPDFSWQSLKTLLTTIISTMMDID